MKLQIRIATAFVAVLLLVGGVTPVVAAAPLTVHPFTSCGAGLHWETDLTEVYHDTAGGTAEFQTEEWRDNLDNYCGKAKDHFTFQEAATESGVGWWCEIANAANNSIIYNTSGTFSGAGQGTNFDSTTFTLPTGYGFFSGVTINGQPAGGGWHNISLG